MASLKAVVSFLILKNYLPQSKSDETILE
ncbi:MAG: hypothetical protein RJA23_1771, partial [Bacteroidota bacterium]